MPKDHDKTEKATPKRKKNARKKGQVAKTPELAGWLVTLVATFIIPALIGSSLSRLEGLWVMVGQAISSPSVPGDLRVMDEGGQDLAWLIVPVLAVMALAGLVINLAQVGPLLTTAPVKPKLSRVSPLAGAKKMFSVHSLWELAKQTLKMGVIGLLAYKTVSSAISTTLGSAPGNLQAQVSYTGTTVLRLVREISAIGLVLAVGDYMVVRRKLNKSLKMSKTEIKRESKDDQGDPLIKGQIRKKQATLSRLRMLAAVAGADVVITNPTHFAVALRYQPGSGRSPQVVAKGADLLALKIREIAQNSKVPVVEDPPLARAVYAACELDGYVPEELYMAVARVLAFVFTLPALIRASGVVQRRPTSALVA